MFRTYIIIELSDRNKPTVSIRYEKGCKGFIVYDHSTSNRHLSQVDLGLYPKLYITLVVIDNPYMNC